MIEFFSEMSGFEKTFWFIGAISSVILIFQLVLTVAGMDSMDGIDGDIDMDMDGDMDSDGGHAPFQLFTFRNLVTFFAVSSWSALSFNDAGFSQTSTLIFSFLIGLTSMLAMGGMVYMLYKMKEENIPSMKYAIGKKGTVYLSIPEKGKGKGKVTVNVNGSKKTVNAYSNGPKFSTNSRIEVIGVEGDDLIVDEVK